MLCILQKTNGEVKLGFNGDLYPTAGASVVMTTSGDMVKYESGARARLGIGSANQILQVKSSLPSWETVDLADTVLTTQGSILYENVSGLAELGFGTTGDVLTTKGTGANPVWETVSAGATITTQEISPLDAQTTTSGSTSVTDGSATLATRTDGTAMIVYYQSANSTTADQIVIELHYNGSIQKTSNSRLATAGQTQLNTTSTTDDLDGGTFALYWGTGGGTATLFNATTNMSRCTIFEVS